MLFFAYLYSSSPHSFSCLPDPCKDQRHYHKTTTDVMIVFQYSSQTQYNIPYRQTHASSHKVW